MSDAPDSHVIAVTYGDEIHVYGLDQQDQADAVYTVGVAAFGDSEKLRIPADKWPLVHEKMRGVCGITDHRKPATTAAG